MDINTFYRECVPAVFGLPPEEAIVEYDKYYAIPCDYPSGIVFDKTTGKILGVDYSKLGKPNKVWLYNKKKDCYELHTEKTCRSLLQISNSDRHNIFF